MILYKYFPENLNSLKSLSLNSIWCHSPLKMNDPLESLYLLDIEYSTEQIKLLKKHLYESGVQEYNNLINLNDSQFSHIINTLRREALKKFAFSSFSEDLTNILMWTHYASCHSGFVLEIDFPQDKIESSDLAKITYKNELPSLDLNELGEFLIKMKDGYKKDFISNISIKSKKWKYEKEWRLWINEPGYYKLKINQIKNLYFGLKSSPEFINLVVRTINTELNPEIRIGIMDFEKNSTKLRKTDSEDDFTNVMIKRKKLESGDFLDASLFIAQPI